MPARLQNDDAVSDVADDVLWGVPSIAAFIGRGIRQTRYLIQRRIIRTTKRGRKTITGSKRQIREDLAPKPTAPVPGTSRA
jgi:hypothetical protein